MALRRMALRDFVLVQALEIDFQSGFTVLSGETGAGKSILIDAMQLVLGARAESGLVRAGAQRAEIVAEFDAPTAPDSPLAQWLHAQGWEADPTDADPTLLLRRTVDVHGKSRAWINGSVATIGQLGELGQWLVDIHGQHAWQSLMRPATVRALLDGYASAQPQAQATGQAWQRWRDALAALEQAQANAEHMQQDRERLQWQLEEIGRLAPQAGEWAQLDQQHTRLAHMQDLQRAASHAWQALDADEGGGALRALTQAGHILAEHRNIEPQFAEWENALAALADPLQDIARALRDYAQAQEWDPAEFAQLDERMGQWLALARRHRQPPEALPELWAQWRAQLAALDAGADIPALMQAEQAARAQYQAAAQALSAQRRAAAPALEAAVTTLMHSLGMSGSRFAIALHTLEQPQAHGLDEVEFLIASSHSGAARPLAKVASGGELSRISLAIAVCTSQLGHAGTLVFDEVDTGIGGAVAHSVGLLMGRLGRDRQVLAVTHLPQVAACANGHLLVQKTVAQQGASSAVQPIEGQARVAEIARMLGGDALTPTTLAHAQEMLARAAQALQASADTAPAPAAAAQTPQAAKAGKKKTAKGNPHA